MFGSKLVALHINRYVIVSLRMKIKLKSINVPLACLLCQQMGDQEHQYLSINAAQETQLHQLSHHSQGSGGENPMSWERGKRTPSLTRQTRR